jgi:hypothetical protein
MNEAGEEKHWKIDRQTTKYTVSVMNRKRVVDIIVARKEQGKEYACDLQQTRENAKIKATA